MIHSLSHRAEQEEQMDAPDLPEQVYAQVLSGLNRINIATLAMRPTLGFLRRALRPGEPFRLLDVGYGDGGMLRSIFRWSKRRGHSCELVGIDLNTRSEAVARELGGRFTFRDRGEIEVKGSGPMRTFFLGEPISKAPS